MKRHFDDGEVLGLLGAVSLFGFLNRRNALLVNELMEGPLRFAQRALPSDRWGPGPHAR